MSKSKRNSGPGYALLSMVALIVGVVLLILAKWFGQLLLPAIIVLAVAIIVGIGRPMWVQHQNTKARNAQTSRNSEPVDFDKL
jgi:Flp pilus assembly protein TadB